MGNSSSARNNKDSRRPEVRAVERLKRASKSDSIYELQHDKHKKSSADKVDKDSKDKVKKRTNLKSYRRRQPSNWDNVDARVAEIDHTQYEFPFENLVLEGGGQKGLAYVGVLQVLEEIGLAKKIKRIAGASAGAMTAVLFAVGYSAEDIYNFLSGNIKDIFNDHSCGYLSLLPNLLSKFGWNPGKKIYHWMGKHIEAQTGYADYTFGQLYRQHGIELCVVVTNLNLMATIYCHPKATPDMPIRLAVRMSIAMPGFYAAQKYVDFREDKDVYVDGGVLCNYPIHCFDGWWLSMAKEDAYFSKLYPLHEAMSKMSQNERFGTYNEKTFGCVVYDEHEQDIHKDELENRRGCDLPKSFPNTKLFRSYVDKQKIIRETAKEHSKSAQAVNSFFNTLVKHDINHDKEISLPEFEIAYNDHDSFKDQEKAYIFGPDATAEDAFFLIVPNSTDKITFFDIMAFLKRTGIDIAAQFLGYKRCEIPNFPSFLETLQSALLMNSKKIYMKDTDVMRTVGINTGYITTIDFNLTKEDREFVVNQGRQATISFLKYFIVYKNLQPKDVEIEASSSTVSHNCLPIDEMSQFQINE